jgi:hypothetical protein
MNERGKDDTFNPGLKCALFLTDRPEKILVTHRVFKDPDLLVKGDPR